MKIITYTCSDCGTIIAGNVLESRREMKCPGLECRRVLRFSDLPDEEASYIQSNRENFTLE